LHLLDHACRFEHSPSLEPIVHRATNLKRRFFCEMLTAATTDPRRANLARVLSSLADSDPKARRALRIRKEAKTMPSQPKVSRTQRTRVQGRILPASTLLDQNSAGVLGEYHPQQWAGFDQNCPSSRVIFKGTSNTKITDPTAAHGPKPVFKAGLLCME
jgi:hypothetical protein